MFFSNTAIRAELLSVLELEWKQQDLHSGDRSYHALSFRKVGKARMITASQEVSAKRGDILLVPANNPYRLISEREEVIVAHFLTQTPLPPTIIKFSPVDPDYYENKFKDLFNAWNRRAAGYEYECDSIFNRILSKIEQEIASRNVAPDDPLAEIMDYISDHFTDRELSLETLARRHGMSGAYLRRRFAERYGTSPMRYIQQNRLRLAKELLQTDYYTVEQVAEQCGFANVYYFSTFIKKETGLPPSKL